MRVHEAAKKFGISSKQVLDLLKKSKINLSSHMSVIPEKGIALLEKSLKESAKKIKPSAKETGVKKEVPAKKTVSKKIPVEKKVEKKEAVVAKKIEAAPEKKVEKVSVAPKPAAVIQKKEKPYIPPKKTFIRPSRPTLAPHREVTEITIETRMPLFKVAELMNKSSSDLILALLKKGMACNRNHLLSTDVISMLGEQFGIEVNFKISEGADEEKVVEKLKKGEKRWPIVVVMGHVDHGKTTLLDFVRKMNTAIREKGGITQHLGAYEVDSSHGKIVFLDTPGHEAFSFLRARGAKATDLAILVVAADDGVKPQTVEAIEHAKKAGVPIVVAINKIDKVSSSAAVQTVKRQLAEHDLVVEDWGGEIVCVPISAKTGQGVEELLEMIVLQSEMLDLRADANLPARAFVLESKLEKGLGPVATIICTQGTMKQGDYFICGSGTGRVRLLVNSFGEKLSQVGPAIPVKVVGFDNFAEIGDWFTVVSKEEYSKAKSTKKTIPPLAAEKTLQAGVSLAENSERQINLIIKTDTRGSKEAIEGSILKLIRKASKDCLPINIVQSGIGDISEGDIELADSTGSLLLGLHIKAEKNAILLAKNKGVKIELFDIIYHMVEHLQELLEKSKKVEIVWKKVAQLVVKKVFQIKKVGTVAGCGVLEGVVSKNNKVECLRGSKVIGGGRIVTLQKEGKVVQQVHAGYECGFTCDGFNEWQEGDLVNCYAQEKPAEQK